MLATSIGVSSYGFAATDVNLPADVSTPLVSATSPKDVAGVVTTAPSNLLPTIFAVANDLDIASPSEVLPEVISTETEIDRVIELVCAGVEGVPAQAELTVRSGFTAAGRPNQDVAEVLAACEADLETADQGGTGSLPPLGGLGVVSFIDLPSAAQNNPAVDDAAPPGGGPNIPGPPASAN